MLEVDPHSAKYHITSQFLSTHLRFSLTIIMIYCYRDFFPLSRLRWGLGHCLPLDPRLQVYALQIKLK